MTTVLSKDQWGAANKATHRATAGPQGGSGKRNCWLIVFVCPTFIFSLKKEGPMNAPLYGDMIDKQWEIRSNTSISNAQGT